MEQITADLQFLLKFRVGGLSDVHIAVLLPVAGGILLHRLFQCRSNADIIDDQPALFVLEHAVHAGNRLHQTVAVHGLVHIHGGKRRHIKTGQPHIHDNRNLERVVVVLESACQFFLVRFGADDVFPILGVFVAARHHNGDFFFPCGAQVKDFAVNLNGNRAGIRHDHRFSGQKICTVLLVVRDNILT